MKHLVGIIFGVSSKNNEPDYTWEKFADEPAEMKMVEGRELTTVSEKNENTTKKKGIFPIKFYNVTAFPTVSHFNLCLSFFAFYD